MIYLIIIAVGLLIFYLTSKESRATKLINEIPGPTPIPIFGNMLMLNLPSAQMWLKILEILDQYYPIARMWFFTYASIFMRHPEDLKVVLSCKKNINKADIGYDNFRFIENDGIIVSGGDKWRSRRKLLNPAFHPKLLKAYTQLAEEQLKRFIDDLKSQEKEITVTNLLGTFTKLNLSIIVESATGVDLNKLSIENEATYRNAFHLVCEVSFYRATRPYIKNWMMRFLSIGREQARAVKILRDFTSKIMQERWLYHKQHDFKMLRNFNNDLNTDDDVRIGSSKLRLAVLDLLLASQLDGLIDEKGIQEELETILAAGHDTTSTSMTFSLMLFAENQHAQELVRTEVVGVANNNDGLLINAEIQKLDYLDRCVKESLRMFPPVPVIARAITDELKLNNYTIPANNDALINFYALHRDPNFWPEPDKFDPDRFLPENSIGRHAFSYLPFSAGPRACNGQKLALMEIKTMLAHLLTNFRVEPIDLIADLKFQMHVTLKPTKPIRLKLIRIN